MADFARYQNLPFDFSPDVRLILKLERGDEFVDGGAVREGGGDTGL